MQLQTWRFAHWLLGYLCAMATVASYTKGQMMWGSVMLICTVANVASLISLKK